MKSLKELDQKYSDIISDIKFQPIFIMGLHRSGTTILYKMLNETGHFNIVTAYHILKYEELLHNFKNNLEEKTKLALSIQFKELGIKNRKIDSIEITPDFTQEYVYLFVKKNLPNKMGEKNKELFENLCKKIQVISNNKKPVLLKNPYDYANFLYIFKEFPNAKFIFINRNPKEIISSNLRAWQTLLESKNPYTSLFSPKYKEIFDNPLLLFLMRTYYSSYLPFGLINIIRKASRETKYFLKNINKIKEKDYVIVKYENLCSNSNLEMKKILDFLKIKSNLDFSNYIKPRKLKMLSEIERMEKYILKKMKSYMAMYDC